jgi:HSP20 family protein
MLVRFERIPVFGPFADEAFGLGEDIGSLLTDTRDFAPLGDAAFTPSIDVAETPEEVIVLAEIPGVIREDVKISIENGLLTIMGERKGNAPSEGERQLLRELKKGKFSRTVRIHCEVNTESVSAELSGGLLKMVLPKAESARAHQINVR